MKLLNLLLCLAVASKKKCKTHQWEKKGKCVKMVGFALENKLLPKQATAFAKQFYDYLDEEQVYQNWFINKVILINLTQGDSFKPPVRLMERLQGQLKKAMAWSSQREKDGKSHCLKEDITPEKLKAIENIALDDYEYSGGPFKGVMRIDHAEQYLENLNHLLFEQDCSARGRMQTRIDKLFKQLDKLCKKQCAAMGFDYFFHNEGAPDYFQYYHDDVDHSENAEILGDKLAMPTGDYADY